MGGGALKELNTKMAMRGQLALLAHGSFAVNRTHKKNGLQDGWCPPQRVLLSGRLHQTFIPDLLVLYRVQSDGMELRGPQWYASHLQHFYFCRDEKPAFFRLVDHVLVSGQR